MTTTVGPPRARRGVLAPTCVRVDSVSGVLWTVFFSRETFHYPYAEGRLVGEDSAEGRQEFPYCRHGRANTDPVYGRGEGVETYIFVRTTRDPSEHLSRCLPQLDFRPWDPGTLPGPLPISSDALGVGTGSCQGPTEEGPEPNLWWSDWWSGLVSPTTPVCGKDPQGHDSTPSFSVWKGRGSRLRTCPPSLGVW